MKITINDAATEAVMELDLADIRNHSSFQIVKALEPAVAQLVQDGGANPAMAGHHTLYLTLTAEVRQTSEVEVAPVTPKKPKKVK